MPGFRGPLMNPIVFALRRPYTVVVGVIAMALAAALVLPLSLMLPPRIVAWAQRIFGNTVNIDIKGMPIDIFPDLNTPVIYVAQPYGGLSPQQMEGHITNYFEYHFLY